MMIAMMVALALYACVGVCPYAFSGQSATQRIDTSSAVSATNGCPAPLLSLNGSAVVARRNATPDYGTLSEIKFTAQISLPFTGVKSQSKSQHRLCKLKCVAGEWVGPLCKIEQNNEDDGRFHPILRSCGLHLNNTNLALVYDGVLLKQWNGRIPDRSRVTILCDGAPGLYKMEGTSHLQCVDGDWNHEIPRCLPTTSISGYSENLPPTLRVKLAFGDSAIDYRHNQVVVYPGSIVHLECLFRRHYGDVRWSWTTAMTATMAATTTTTTSAQTAQLLQQQQNRLTGWSIAADEREWIYRMSLYYVKTEQDSGNYTCITPKHQNNTVTLKVEGRSAVPNGAAIQCEKRTENERKNNVISNSKKPGNGNHIGQTIEFTCSVGFALIGANRSSCLADGKWSSPVPYCEQIRCVSLNFTDVHLGVSGSNNTYGSTIAFRCAPSYALKGTNEIRCEIDGQWSSSIPKCVDIVCAAPSIPVNGYLLERSNGPNYRAGTIVQFACEKPYRLVGDESIICEENSMWSSAPPSCKIVCEFPGEPTNGRLVPSKFWYETGDVLKVVCNIGYVTSESELSFVLCTKNGTWLTKIPRCVNFTEV